MFKHVYVMVIVILSKSCFFVHVDSFVVSNKPNDGKRFIRSLGKVVFAFNALYWICQSDSSIWLHLIKTISYHEAISWKPTT